MTRIAIVALAIALTGASAARADNPTLTGNVGAGDSFTISLSPTHNLVPGTYTLVVHDLSAIHDFHLFGPGGVDVSTTIEGIGDQTFTVNLVAGTYTYVCDAHPSMKGSFTVGAVTSKPAPKPKHHAKPKKKKKKQ